MRHPGFEPGSSAWEADMLTTTPMTLIYKYIYYMYRPGIELQISCLAKRINLFE